LYIQVHTCINTYTTCLYITYTCMYIVHTVAYLYKHVYDMSIQ
jgi:hypothetical protein